MKAPKPVSLKNRGIALVLVMMVIAVLAVLAGAFAFSMKIETKLARNTTSQTQLEWMGRSGVELARFFLGQSMTLPNEQYDSLNQKWAGGPMGTNDVLAEISLDNVQIGDGTISIEIEDLERYYNINVADNFALRQALIVMGADAGDSDTLVDSILDWIDPDDSTHSSGAESRYYEGLEPPYVAKNGPIDDLSELLLVQGVTPEVYWGPKVSAYRGTPQYQQARFLADEGEEFTYPLGFVDLFTPVSARLININTASAQVLQLVPGIDENTATGIVMARAGPDGADGTEDDIPFRNTGELINVPGMSTQAAGALNRVFGVRSATFRVRVQATLYGHQAIWHAIVRRESPTDVKLLTLYRE